MDVFGVNVDVRLDKIVLMLLIGAIVFIYSSHFIVEKVFELFTHKHLLLLGQESALATAWMFICLIIRAVSLNLDLSISTSVIFAFPLLAQCMMSMLIEKSHPVLIVRVMEALLGRTHVRHLTVIIPAHFLGHIIGAVLFGATLGSVLGTQALEPLLDQQQPPSILNMLYDVISVATYVVLQIVVPELLLVNKVSRFWLTAPYVPLLLYSKSSFNPCAMYALCFVQSQSVTHLHLVAVPFVGIILGSVVCGIVTPDDSSSWKAVTRR